MDIKGKIEEIISKIKSDKNFASTFASNPIKAVESVLGVDLPDNMVQPIIDGVKAKLAGGQAGDALGSITKMF